MNLNLNPNPNPNFEVRGVLDSRMSLVDRQHDELLGLKESIQMQELSLIDTEQRLLTLSREKVEA